MGNLTAYRRSKRELPADIRTPFRAALLAGNYTVAWDGRETVRNGQRAIAMHIIGTDLRALCGARRPKGGVSDMTLYAWEDQTCRKCLRSFLNADGGSLDPIGQYEPAAPPGDREDRSDG